MKLENHEKEKKVEVVGGAIGYIGHKNGNEAPRGRRIQGVRGIG